MILCAVCADCVEAGGDFSPLAVPREIKGVEHWYCSRECANLDEYAYAKYGKSYKVLSEDAKSEGFD